MFSVKLKLPRHKDTWGRGVSRIKIGQKSVIYFLNGPYVFFGQLPADKDVSDKPKSEALKKSESNASQAK